MLVEDDKSLREIYGVRLLAEGYDIVSAGDGEEALAMAIKERPSLIISDVMMPKISGFDMLDILRSTTETKSIKVIMMTALSSDEQRRRGESLGADRYLVKSQVGIEDVVRVVHEVLGDSLGSTPPGQPAAPAAAPTAPPRTAPPAVINTQPTAQTQPVAPTTMPTTSAPPAMPAQSTPAAPPPSPPAPTTLPTPATPAGLPVPPAAASTARSQPLHSSSSPAAPSSRNRIIQPLNDPSKSPIDINDLLDKELAKEATAGQPAAPAPPTPPAPTTPSESPTASSDTSELPSVSIAPDGRVIPNPPPPQPPQSPSPPA